jgi:hypothetical protein
MSRMLAYLPIAAGVLIIVGLTYVQFEMTDRLSAPTVTAEQRAELLKNIPDKIGDWHGTNIAIDENVRQTAGAVGAVQRKYRNVRTNEEVDLWLIVGRGREVARHTPDVCYRSSGFTARSAENSPYFMEQDDGTSVQFLTNTFYRDDITGRRLIRVFWTWYDSANAKEKDKIVWEVHSNPTWYFGNTRALFKMYFTSAMRDPMETADKSPCLNFAREFLPVVNNALLEVSNPAAAASAKADDASAAKAEPADEATAEDEPVDTKSAQADDVNAEVPATTSEESTAAPAPAAEAEPASK